MASSQDLIEAVSSLREAKTVEDKVYWLQDMMSLDYADSVTLLNEPEVMERLLKHFVKNQELVRALTITLVGRLLPASFPARWRPYWIGLLQAVHRDDRKDLSVMAAGHLYAFGVVPDEQVVLARAAPERATLATISVGVEIESH